MPNHSGSAAINASQSPRKRGSKDAIVARGGDSAMGARTEVASRRGAEHALERRDERARALVADLERDRRHGLAAREEAHRMQQARLLAPATERHARLAPEEPLERAPAGARRASERI